jgi:IPT/TIG domain
MADQLDHVRPGDLIRADFVNDILDAIRALDDRVLALERSGPGDGGGTQVVISQVNPPSPRIGEEMRVTGQNFGVSTGAAVVVVDDLLITALKAGTSDTVLVFDAPDRPDVPPGGRQVVLVVRNATSRATKTFTLLPRPSAGVGDIDIHYLGVTPATITAGQSAAFHFQLRSREPDVPVTLTLTAAVSTGWSPVQLLDDQVPGQPLPFGRLTVGPLQQRDFFVSVPVPAGTAQDTPFTVGVTGKGQGVTTSSGDRPFLVGRTPPAQPDYINLSVAGGATTVRAAPRQQVVVQVLAEFGRVGTYVVDASVVPGQTGWQVDKSGIPADGFLIQNIPQPGQKVAQPFLLGLTAPATAPAQDPHCVISANLKGETAIRELQLRLEVA